MYSALAMAIGMSSVFHIVRKQHKRTLFYSQAADGEDKPSSQQFSVGDPHPSSQKLGLVLHRYTAHAGGQEPQSSPQRTSLS